MGYLQFNEMPNEGKKTKMWCVVSIVSDKIVGRVHFRGSWGKYVFEPVGTPTFDVSCLREITERLEQIDREVV
jgi:ornithine cyclodeaminase/alanine dehydrogenase-like protein (mu-crystallin family)